MRPCLECVIMMAAIFAWLFGLDWYLAMGRWLGWKRG
jgi:hypothetical protein